MTTTTVRTGQQPEGSGGGGDSPMRHDVGPLAALATIQGLGWLAVLLYADAIVSSADTGLVSTTVTARTSSAMAEDGNAPQKLARLTKDGVPLVSLVVTFFLGLIVFLSFPSWQQLVGSTTSATALSSGTGPLVLAAMRRQMPDHPRTFRVPGGDVVPYLAFLSSNLIVFWAGWTTGWKPFVAVGLGYLVLVVLRLTGNDLPMDWRSGATWMVPWFAGLALLSYLGTFSEGRGVIGSGIAIPVTAVFSAAIYVLALAVRLSPEVVAEHVETTHREPAVEEEELGASH